jgi:hypothetical protein
MIKFIRLGLFLIVINLTYGFSQINNNADSSLRKENVFLIIHLQEDIIRYNFDSIRDFEMYSEMILDEIPTCFGLKKGTECEVELELTFSITIGNSNSMNTKSVQCLNTELVIESRKLSQLLQTSELH